MTVRYRPGIMKLAMILAPIEHIQIYFVKLSFHLSIQFIRSAVVAVDYQISSNLARTLFNVTAWICLLAKIIQ